MNPYRLRHGLVDLDNFTVNDFSIESAVMVLCEMGRFGNQPDHFYSVGAHTVGMINWFLFTGKGLGAQRLAFAHDLHESITGDIPTPLKNVLGPSIDIFQNRLDTVIFEAIGLDWTVDEYEMVVNADRIAAATEYKMLFGEDLPGGVPTDDRILFHAEVSETRETLWNHYRRLFQ